MQYKAVIFDLDGTLLDTLADLANSMNRVLKKYNFPTHSLDDYRMFVGEGVKMLIKRSLPMNSRNKDTIEACINAFREDYGNNWKVKTKLYNGIAEMLDILSIRGLKLTVLSNKPDDFTKLCVKEFLSRWNFHIVMGQRDSIPHKPDPTGAREIAKQLKLPPEVFIYLGDTAIDMQTANAAGMFPVGVLWGFRTREELRKHGAKLLIERPEEIFEKIPNLYNHGSKINS